jgi:adenylate kinase family enzyme
VRVSVIGSSGAGKSTFGRRLAERLGCAFIELDGIYHQAGWRELGEEEFRARVAPLVAGEAWVCDGNYSKVHRLVLARATDVVWIDPSKAVVMAQVIWRSVSRAAMGRELWNGNRERFRGFLDPEHPIRWAWSTFERRRVEYEGRMRAAEYSHVRFHRLRDRRQMRAFVESAAADVQAAGGSGGLGGGGLH